MDAVPFAHPYEFIPKLVRIPSADAPAHLLFEDVDGDQGLRRATEFFWNAKTISATYTGTALIAYPAAEADLIKPASRSIGWAAAAVNFGVGDSKIDNPSDPGLGGEAWGISLSFGQIIYLTDVERYAVPISFVYWSNSSGQGKPGWPAEVWVGDAESYGTAFTPTIPSWLSIPSGVGFYYYLGFADPPPPAASLSITVDFWTYPA